MLITGASRGIGEAAALRLASPDRHLLLAARSTDALARHCETIRAQGGHADYLECDLSDMEAAAALVDRAREAGSGRVDAVVLNAGMSLDKSFLNTNAEAFDYELTVNYRAPACILREVLPEMVERGRGQVVLVGSLTALVPFPGNASYAAAKAALFSLARGLRVELHDSGVHLGVVLPGFTDTELTDGKSSVLPAMDPETVAEAIEDCLGGESLRVPGKLNRLTAKVFQSFPDASDHLLESIAEYVVPGYDD